MAQREPEVRFFKFLCDSEARWLETFGGSAALCRYYFSCFSCSPITHVVHFGNLKDGLEDEAFRAFASRAGPVVNIEFLDQRR